MNDVLYNAGLIAAFIAVMLLVYGVFELLGGSESPEQRRLKRRIKQLRNTANAASRPSLRSKDKRNQRAVEKMIAQMPRYGSLTEVLAQAGYSIGAATFVINLVLTAGIATLIALAIGISILGAVYIAICAGGFFFLRLWYKRNQRLQSIEKQLPDTVDLIARALRAGHAFTPTMKMVSDELPDPISGEFRQVSEEISFGIPVEQALMGLARRLPLEDIRFFVIAVTLQRETGGNLAEILDSIGHLIRERFKLMGQVRVLTAEGRMSGWALSIMPFATAGMLFVVNDEFMATLWKDPLGVQLVTGAGVLMFIGIFWLWRLVKIRV